MAIDLAAPVSRGDRILVLACCGLSLAALTVSERYLGPRVPLAGFFFLPLFIAAALISRWSIFLLAVVVALAREAFGPFPSPWEHEALARLAVSMVAFTGGGLFAGELVRNRRMALELLVKTTESLDAEREARALVESSPAAVLTVDPKGNITKANDAARRILGFTSDSPEGEAVENYIPLLAKLLRSKRVVNLTRTMVEASGRRRNGQAFYSQAWVSSYDSASGPRLAAILLDVTEQIRDREETGLRQLLSNSKIIAGAVSHELRNLAAAAAVLHHNASRSSAPHDSADFEALGNVIQSVLKLSSEDLSDSSEELLEGLDVLGVLQELRMIISPKFGEAGTEIQWEIAEPLPQVRANHSGLLQVFLNVAQNSQRALQSTPGGRLRVAAYALPESVLIRFSDNGPGISAEERLFQPFQAGSSATGLGLFVSRAIIRTFGGELHHTQRPGECCFIIELPPVAVQDSASV